MAKSSLIFKNRQSGRWPISGLLSIIFDGLKISSKLLFPRRSRSSTKVAGSDH